MVDDDYKKDRTDLEALKLFVKAGSPTVAANLISRNLRLLSYIGSDGSTSAQKKNLLYTPIMSESIAVGREALSCGDLTTAENKPTRQKLQKTLEKLQYLKENEIGPSDKVDEQIAALNKIIKADFDSHLEQAEKTIESEHAGLLFTEKKSALEDMRTDLQILSRASSPEDMQELQAKHDEIVLAAATQIGTELREFIRTGSSVLDHKNTPLIDSASSAISELKKMKGSDSNLDLEIDSRMITLEQLVKMAYQEVFDTITNKKESFASIVESGDLSSLASLDDSNPLQNFKSLVRILNKFQLPEFKKATSDLYTFYDEASEVAQEFVLKEWRATGGEFTSSIKISDLHGDKMASKTTTEGFVTGGYCATLVDEIPDQKSVNNSLYRLALNGTNINGKPLSILNLEGEKSKAILKDLKQHRAMDELSPMISELSIEASTREILPETENRQAIIKHFREGANLPSHLEEFADSIEELRPIVTEYFTKLDLKHPDQLAIAKDHILENTAEVCISEDEKESLEANLPAIISHLQLGTELPADHGVSDKTLVKVKTLMQESLNSQFATFNSEQIGVFKVGIIAEELIAQLVDKQDMNPDEARRITTKELLPLLTIDYNPIGTATNQRADINALKLGYAPGAGATTGVSISSSEIAVTATLGSGAHIFVQDPLSRHQVKAESKIIRTPGDPVTYTGSSRIQIHGESEYF